MGVLSQEERIKILSDIIEIQSVNDKELEVAQYLQKLFSSYDIKSDIVKLDDSNTRADLVAEIGE